MDSRPAWGPTGLAAVALVIAAAGCAPARDPTSPEASRAAGGRPAAAAVRPAQRVPSQVVPQAPRTLRLPGGATVRVRAVGTRRDGRLAVPKDVHTAGWWRGGARVGDPFGAILVAGHVDSRTQGLGAYAELLTVRRGQLVVVRTASLRQTYRIRSLHLVPQAPLAGRSSLHSPRGPHRLVLVTCAPPYDPARGGYQHLAVVTAYPVGRPTRRRSP
jgi:hypothetical protein